MQGRLQLKQKLTNTANQAIIDTRNLVNGSYHCSLMVDGQLKSTVKIIIQH
jgi:predicted hotdog family 3-hydroxylacyl-ACP dehydratase